MTNITRPRKVTYCGVPALTWEVREGGAASLRTCYTQWTEDGKHWVSGEPQPMANGGTYTPGWWEDHRAGDVRAYTVRGNFNRGTGVTVVKLHDLPAGAPTDVVITD